MASTTEEELMAALTNLVVAIEHAPAMLPRALKLANRCMEKYDNSPLKTLAETTWPFPQGRKEDR